ncbi:MAG: hypothetical protein AAF797_09470 [Planctomycetota bacterium]
MDPKLLSKSFRFEGHRPTRGVVVTGAAYIDPDGVYLLYRSHFWQTGLIIGCVFGPIGMLIAAVLMWRKSFEMPLPTSPLSEMPRDILDALKIKKAKPSHTLAVIPRDAVHGYRKSITKGLRFQLDGLELAVISPKSRVVRELASLGYEPNPD